MRDTPKLLMEAVTWHSFRYLNWDLSTGFISSLQLKRPVLC